MKQLTEAERAKKRRLARKWWRKNKSKAVMAKKAEQLNGHALVDLPAIIKAFQTLHGATNDGQIKADVTKVFASVVSKVV